MQDLPAALQHKANMPAERAAPPFDHPSTCQNYVKSLFSIAALK
jgi:hypothetical protein